MKFDPAKHQRRSIRLQGYDYAQPGGYFVTIVTYQRACLFGEIVGKEIRLSKYGLVAQQQWEKLPKRFPNIEMGAFVVMPNHIHGIIQIMDESRRARRRIQTMMTVNRPAVPLPRNNFKNLWQVPSPPSSVLTNPPSHIGSI